MRLNQNIVSRLMSYYYPQLPRDPLEEAFCAHARDGMRVLDAGCGGNRVCSGAALPEGMYVVGVDKDPAVQANSFCHETFVCNLADLPLDDASFDLIHCRWVIEHLENPLRAFQEFARVLKPGGQLLVLTPNIFHYGTIAARLTPHWFHRWWWRGGEDEPFSTFYRANCPHKLRSLCTKAGLRVQRLELIESPPYYLTKYWPAFLCGVVYERIVNSTKLFSRMRQCILVQADIPLEIA